MSDDALLNGTYRLLRCIGSGGFGEVWLAQQRLGKTAGCNQIPGGGCGYPPSERVGGPMTRYASNVESRPLLDHF